MKHSILLCFLLSIASPNFYANEDLYSSQQSDLTPITSNQYPDLENEMLHEETAFHLFFKPITFDQDGITHFFTYVYNHELYPDFLAHNLMHFIQMLEFGKHRECGIGFTKSALQLCMQKLKITEYLSSSTVIDFVQQLPHLITLTPTSLQEQESKQALHEAIHTDLATMFSNYYSLFKQNPSKFLHITTANVVKKAYALHADVDLQQEQTRKDILRLLELCIQKTVWDFETIHAAWQEVIDLTHASYALLQAHLISDADSFHDICWSLVARFAYMLTLEYEDISQQDLLWLLEQSQDTHLLLFHTKEAEPTVQDKQQYLQKKIQSLLQKKQRRSRAHSTPTHTTQLPGISRFMPNENAF